MSNRLRPEKWAAYGGKASIWWEGLSMEEKKKFKTHFENIREWNKDRKFCQYPNMYDTTFLRVSQLTQKHIYRIWSFRDHTLN